MFNCPFEYDPEQPAFVSETIYDTPSRAAWKILNVDPQKSRMDRVAKAVKENKNVWDLELIAYHREMEFRQWFAAHAK